jgi:hypothetical protein
MLSSRPARLAVAPARFMTSVEANHIKVLNEDTIVPWLLQPQAIWMALAGGLVPGLIAVFKRRAVTLWYLYGFACTLVAWPLLAVPTIHALLVRRLDTPQRSPQGQRRADALALIAESGVQSYPSWIADLKGKSPTGIDRRHYAYQHLGSGEALELVRKPTERRSRRGVLPSRSSPWLRPQATALDCRSARRWAFPHRCRQRCQD